MIDVKGISKTYGAVQAVRDVSFAVNSGEIVGFLGPNGAGKSTTMRIVTGFTPANAGQVFVAGHSVADAPLQVKRQIGYMPESVPLYPEMTVRSFLNYVAEIKGVARSTRRKEVSEVMERVGLSGMGHRPIGHLSKGYRQRVGLAQALIGSPPVLILDEPTVGLDPKQIIEIRELIKGLAPQHTVLLSTHILPEVQMLCERVVIIHQGRVVAQDSMANLRQEGDDTIVDVVVSGDGQQVHAALGAVEGVAKVDTVGAETYRVFGPRDPALPERVARALSAAGLGLRSLAPHAPTLEEIFVDAVSKEESQR